MCTIVAGTSPCILCKRKTARVEHRTIFRLTDIWENHQAVQPKDKKMHETLSWSWQPWEECSCLC